MLLRVVLQTVLLLTLHLAVCGQLAGNTCQLPARAAGLAAAAAEPGAPHSTSFCSGGSQVHRGRQRRGQWQAHCDAALQLDTDQAPPVAH